MEAIYKSIVHEQLKSITRLLINTQLKQVKMPSRRKDQKYQKEHPKQKQKQVKT